MFAIGAGGGCFQTFCYGWFVCVLSPSLRDLARHRLNIERAIKSIQTNESYKCKYVIDECISSNMISRVISFQKYFLQFRFVVINAERDNGLGQGTLLRTVTFVHMRSNLDSKCYNKNVSPEH